MYQVNLQQFQGPFDLLIELIDKKRLPISEISLAKVADQYLAHLKQIEQFPIKEVASFIVIAATLMLIKARSLLPSLRISEEEEMEIEGLEERLKQYKQFRALARGMEHIFGKELIFSREAYLQIEPIFIKPEGLTLLKLKKIMGEVITNLPQNAKIQLPERMVKKTISLEQKIDDLIKRVENKIKICFSEFQQNNKHGKVGLIVNFLALLELTKRGLIMVRQDKIFGEIEIEKHETKQQHRGASFFVR